MRRPRGLDPYHSHEQSQERSRLNSGYDLRGYWATLWKADRKAQQQAERQLLMTIQTQLDIIDQVLEKVHFFGDWLTKGALILAKNIQSRRRRRKEKMNDHAIPDVDGLPSRDEIRRLVQQASAGGAAAEKLREWMDSRNAIWPRLGILATRGEEYLITLIAGQDPLRPESVKRTFVEMKKELTKDPSSALEKLGVDRVVHLYLQSTYIDFLLNNARPGTAAANYLLRRQAQEHRQFEGAFKSLAAAQSLAAQMQQHASAEEPGPAEADHTTNVAVPTADLATEPQEGVISQEQVEAARQKFNTQAEKASRTTVDS